MNIRKIATVLMLILTLAGCKNKGTETDQVDRPIISGVQTAQVSLAEVPFFYETTGTVMAKSTVNVAARIMGEVTAIKCKEGDLVKTGQLLLSIDDRQLRQQITAAEAALSEAKQGLATANEQRKLAEITYLRYKKLFDEKAISGQEIDQIKTRMQVAGLQYEMAGQAVTRAEAGLAQARIAHGFASVHAPIGGIIVKKLIEVGGMASPSVKLLTIAQDAPYHIDVEVDENKANLLREHLPVEVEIPSQAKKFTGEITTIVKAVDPQSRAMLVKISLKAKGLNSGLFARVYLPEGTRNTLVIPASAVVNRGQLTGAYSVDAHNLVTFRLIRTGSASQAGVEVLSGLKENEQVIYKGADRAVDGGVLQTEKRS